MRLSILALLFLTACAHTSPSTSVCVRVTPYTPEQQAALATAYDQLDKLSPLRSAVQDLKRMRDEARKACP